METVLYWLTSLASLAGVWLNIRRRVACFWIWSATNAVWVVADLLHGIYPQAALQAVYVALSLYGIWAWSRVRAGEAERC
jgi:nicotinamide mononucleotide transporter